MRNRATTSLSKAKIRQSWSKWNLYNLSRLRVPHTESRTFFQQKWSAKSAARAYHGEQVSESQWERMFSRRIRSVIPMNPVKLAHDDGSSVSAGRGSGLEEESVRRNKPDSMPYTHMTFAPLERRLDVAIFRALFASSARQARQFVVHGAVTVNGKKMRYPGYLLNPGDMFQVDPERVMYATGAPKDKFDRRQARIAQKKADEAKEDEGEAMENAEVETENKEPELENLDTKSTLKTLLSQAKTILTGDKDVLPAKRKQELRGFQKAVRRVMSRTSEHSTILTDNFESQFADILAVLKAKKIEAKKPKGKDDKKSKDVKESKENAESKATEASKTESASSATESTETQPTTSEDTPTDALSEAFRQAAEDPDADVDTSLLTEDEYDVLKRALVQLRDNPIDNSKPYATPWRPRNYMSAFAFIPRYLEVNQNICAAVYLRHPVARPGISEVPTPFGEKTQTGSFHWYLRRR
ncbi:hypothetical protein BJX70DRAFT_379896 [Aspergillus crustosus]